MFNVKISKSTQDFFKVSSDDLIVLLTEYLDIPETELINFLEHIEQYSGYPVGWIVEFIIIRTHYKDLKPLVKKYREKYE